MPASTLKMTPQSTATGMRAFTWWVVAVSSLIMAGYALGYLVLGDRLYPAELLESFRARPWGIYTHAFFGLVGIGIGPFQFRRSLLASNPDRHRLLGKTYLIAAVMVGLSGVYMSLYSYGGLPTHTGFGFMGVALLITSAFAYRRIRGLDVVAHREWVIRSFSLMFAAVTFRLSLGGLMAATAGNFDVAYPLASWLCWVPNLIAAEAYIRMGRARSARGELPSRVGQARVASPA